MKHLFIKYLFLRHISFSERFEQPTSEVKSYHLHFLKKSRLLQWNHFSTHFSSTLITQPWDMVIFSPSHKKSWARKQSKAISVSETSCDLSRAMISALKTHLGCPTSAHYKTWHHPACSWLGLVVVSSRDEALLQQMACLSVFYFRVPGPGGFFWPLLLKQQWWECFPVQGEKQTPANRTLHPLKNILAQTKSRSWQIPCGRTEATDVSANSLERKLYPTSLLPSTILLQPIIILGEFLMALMFTLSMNLSSQHLWKIKERWRKKS